MTHRTSCPNCGEKFTCIQDARLLETRLATLVFWLFIIAIELAGLLYVTLSDYINAVEMFRSTPWRSL